MRNFLFALGFTLLALGSTATPPRDIPTTNIVSGFVFSPTLYEHATGRSLSLPQLIRLGINVETAIHYYLNGGVAMTALFIPQAPIRFLLEVSPYIKPQYPIDTQIGRFTFYGTLSLGSLASYWTGQEINNFLGSPLGPSGFGIQAMAVGGIEYFPIPPCGIFAEGGYSGRYLWVNKIFPQYTLAPLAMHGPVLNFGLRVAF